MKTLFAFCLLTVILLTYLFCNKEQNGSIVLVGGGSPIPSEIFQWVSDHKSKGNVLLVTTDDEIGMKWDNLFKLDIPVSVIPPEDLTIARIKDIGAILIDGGDQYHYLSRLNASVLQVAHENNILIFGTSAGAMILGEFYFTAEHGTISSEETLKNPDDQRICIDRNFLKIKSLEKSLVDSHYLERDREGRVRVFLKKCHNQGLSRGIGIDEGTALCIDPEGKTKVIGNGGVHFIQDSSYSSLYPDDTSSYSRSFAHLDQK